MGLEFFLEKEHFRMGEATGGFSFTGSLACEFRLGKGGYLGVEGWEGARVHS